MTPRAWTFCVVLLLGFVVGAGAFSLLEAQRQPDCTSGCVGVSVTPDGGKASAFAGSPGNQVSFAVQNTGLVAATYTLTCSRTGNVTCAGVSPSSMPLDPGEDQNATVTYTAGAVGSGTIKLSASGGGTDNGTYTVTIAQQGPPVVALRNHNRDNVDRSLCLTAGAGESAAWSCGDLVITHAMPGFSTLGRERALTLVYNSATGTPRPAVAVSVTQPATIFQPTGVLAELKVGGIVRVAATYNSWPSGSGARQVAMTYNAAVDSTGAYPIQMRIQNQYTGGGAFDAMVQDTLLVVNRFFSEYGAGFNLAGVEQLYFHQPVNTGLEHILWVGGDGSARLYRRLTDPTKWEGALGAYRDTISLAAGVYTRTLRHGVQVKFNIAGHQIATVNRAGQQTTFTWNGAGSRLVSITVPPGGVSGTTYTLAWDGNNNLDYLMDPAGRKLDATFNANDGRLSSLTDPDGKTVVFGWSADRQIIARQSRRGFTTTYQYSTCRLTTATVPVGRVTGDNATAVTTFDNWNDKGFANGPTGQIAALVTQAYTTIYGPRFYSAPSVADTATFVVDRWGAPTQLTTPAGATTTISRGDPLHPALVTRVVAPNGTIDTLWYNARGNLVEARDSTWHLGTTLRLPTSANTYTYPGSGPATDSPLTVKDALNHTTTYTYNTQGLADSVTDARLHRTKFYYRPQTDSLRGQIDSIAERSVLTYKQSTATTVTRDLTQRFGYYPTGNLKTSTMPTGLVTSYVRDAVGRITDVYDPLSNRRNLSYDAVNRMTQSVQYTAKQTNPVISNPLAGCDATQLSCADTIPAAYVPSLPATLTTTYRYGPVELDTVIDPRSVMRTYLQDARGLQWQQKDEFSHPDSATYDVAGLLSSIISRSADTVRYRYDVAGRRTSMAYGLKDYSADCQPNPSPSCVTQLQITGDSATYSYDVEGRLLVARNERGTITRSYYGDGSLRQRIDALTGLIPDTLMYEYDAARAVTRIVHGRDVRDSTTYGYNGFGDLQTLDWIGAGLSNYHFAFVFDELGRRQQVTYHNGTVVTIHYDAAGTLREVLSNHPGGPTADILDFTFRKLTVNPAAFVTADSLQCMSGIMYGSPCGTLGRLTHVHAYNRLGMLAQQTSSGAVDSMGYDASGNLLFRRDGATGGRHSFSMVATSNRLASDTMGQMQYQYRDDGARKLQFSTSGPYSSRFYYYDQLGRMTGTWGFEGAQPVNDSQTCLYDADGEMAKPCENGAPWLAYDGPNVIATPVSSSNGEHWRWVHGPGLDDPLLGWYRSQAGSVKKVYYYVTDGQGRHLAFADSTGTLTSDDYNLRYLDKGGKFAGGTGSAETFQADRFSSPETPALSLFRNRAYDQNTGRWTQEDPIGVGGGVNLYQFNGNNPVSLSDPFGLKVCFSGTKEHVAELRGATEDATNTILLLDRKNCVVSSVSRGNEAFDRIRGMFAGLVNSSQTFTLRYTRTYDSEQISEYFIDIFEKYFALAYPAFVTAGANGIKYHGIWVRLSRMNFFTITLCRRPAQ